MSTQRNNVNSVKQKIKNGQVIGSIGNYVMYYLELLGVVGTDETSNEINYIWSGTQAEYDNLDNVNDDTLYFIE